MIIAFLFSLWDCYMGPIWATCTWANPYGTHAKHGCTPHMGSPYGTHIGMFAGSPSIWYICHMTMFKKKFWPLGHPQCPKSPTPGAWSRRQNKNPVWYVLYLLFMRTHTKFGIWLPKFNDIWPLTSPQGHQFDPRMKILLAFCFACNPPGFDMPHDHVWKKNVWIPRPQSPIPGAWPWWQNENHVCYVLYLSFVRTHTKFGI